MTPEPARGDRDPALDPRRLRRRRYPALHLLPETRLRYTFPEFASWPTVFREPDNPYLGTQLLGFTTPKSAAARDGGSAPGSTATLHPDSYYVYQFPYHATHMVDSRLSSVKAARWTSVTAADALFEYIGTRSFQKDLFLDDLVRSKTDFCSALLHGLTSDPHRVEFWTPRSLPFAFMAEAKRLWDIGIAGEPKRTTIQAAMCLTMRYGTDGAGKISVPFLVKAVELADKMEFFARRETEDSKMSIARAFTALVVVSYQGHVTSRPLGRLLLGLSLCY
ncbi:uncharacterized protein B0T15DRAFT_550448 [Chaetomium strumarium]|uniref:Transcription factor domain-containing protein n=1 Tax=Chaetomium strumarium TaxID=1170767 RepID=A0AAJ0GY97_9PEZI|nr:hypothetical protein B0T15DRAFT_550448 [Chaetomium strumarium]